ncbi:MAG: amidohydrolase family protein [Dehalococcoidia bacterium]|nr:amidohydrolase family protein [Dehalococcoidia bacterium]
MNRPRAIDSLVNSSFLAPADDAALSYLFKDITDRPVITEPEQLLEALDAAGVGAAVVSIMEPEHARWVGDAHARFPRKILPAMIVDPTKGMDEIRRVVHYYEKFGVRCLRIPPFRYTLPPTDRAYWPFYVKAIELDIPVSMNAGMPGPRVPGWVQNPVHYDEVAFHFPELRLIMSHCGQPWTAEAISVMTHWDNVSMSATSVAPKYWPPELIQFINTRGREKMLYGTEYPTIQWERSRAEIEALGLRPEVTPGFFVENARRVFRWDADVD